MPLANIALNTVGFAQLVAGYQQYACEGRQRGMWFSSTGISAAHTSSSRPWVMVASGWRPPALMFAEERTITEVMGRPPIRHRWPCWQYPARAVRLLRIRNIFSGIQLVRGFEVQQCFDRSYQRYGGAGDPYLPVHQLAEIRQRELADKAVEGFRYRQRYQVRLLQGEV